MDIADGEEPAAPIKGIPGFWLTCLTSHPAVSELITNEDLPALEALADITCAYNEDFTSFTLSFHFNENEFFTNKVCESCNTVGLIIGFLNCWIEFIGSGV